MPPAAVDPIAAAEEAALVYVSDVEPGIRRLGTRAGFRYVDTTGRPVRDSATLAHIKSIAIPPAWRDVWICPKRNGHIQATGRDARGRKQYRYHPRWREVRDRTKYERMVAFGEALPLIRERVDADLAEPGLPREKVLAAVIRLLDTTLIRVGNKEYADDNKSYGLTTLRDRHVGVNGATMEFEFRGKGGKKHQVSIRDRRIAGIVRRLQDLPGQELFQYIDEDGERRPVGSGDVNAYLREITGQEFSAKDFRTWTATVLAMMALRACGPATSQAAEKANITRAVEEVAQSLGNTAAISRQSYIHPHVFQHYSRGSLAEFLQGCEKALDDEVTGLAPQEAAALAMLRAGVPDEVGEAAEAAGR
jgi:DNA topoisomerase-1